MHNIRVFASLRSPICTAIWQSQKDTFFSLYEALACYSVLNFNLETSQNVKMPSFRRTKLVDTTEITATTSNWQCISSEHKKQSAHNFSRSKWCHSRSIPSPCAIVASVTKWPFLVHICDAIIDAILLFIKYARTLACLHDAKAFFKHKSPR